MASKEEINQEIRQLAFYEVYEDAIPQVLVAIKEFVEYIRANEPGTRRYEVWQERDHPARFTHIFVFRNARADQAHSESAEVKKFASILYPQCLEPVKFVDYYQLASNIAPSL
jgi:quinol monooxygenase YgiN